MSVVSTNLPLRDFDGETDDDTDSETELLIRHVGRSGGGGSGGAGIGSDGQNNTSTRKLNNSTQQPQRYGSYSVHNNKANNNHRNQAAPSFLSQLFGVVSGTTKFSSSSGYDKNSNQRDALTPSNLRSATISSTSGQVRLRNERSRERNQTTANITASQTINNAAQAAKFGQTPSSKSSYNLNNSTLVNPVYSDSLQMSTMMDTTTTTSTTHQPNITTTTSPVNGAMQTVIDPENGSTTVFYQKNRRKSKKRSFGNLCKMCLCG